MDLEALKAGMPKIAENLARMMVDDALRMHTELGCEINEAWPSVSIAYQPTDGSPTFKVTLSIEKYED